MPLKTKEQLGERGGWIVIEVVSADHECTSSETRKPHIYLEVYGETQPQLDEAYGQVLPPSSDDRQTGVPAASGPIYEYWWTLGHSVEHHADAALADRILHRSPDFWTDLRVSTQRQLGFTFSSRWTTTGESRN